MVIVDLTVGSVCDGRSCGDCGNDSGGCGGRFVGSIFLMVAIEVMS